MKLKNSNIDEQLKAFSYILSGFKKDYDLPLQEKIDYVKRNFYFDSLVTFSR